VDLLAARAEMLRTRAPFAPRLPLGGTARERALRHYLASFGIECPPRTEGERDKTAVTMSQAFDKLLGEKLRPSIVYAWAPAPEEGTALAQSLRRMRARHVDIRWVQPAVDLAPVDLDAVRTAVYDAVRARAELAQDRGARILKRLGARPASLRRAAQSDAPPATAVGRLLADPNDASPPSTDPAQPGRRNSDPSTDPAQPGRRNSDPSSDAPELPPRAGERR
jgi:hypothetical protein